MATNVAQFSTENVLAFAPPYKPTAKYPSLLVTTSEEPLIPVRLFFQVFPRKIAGHFSNMSCITKEGSYYMLAYEGAMLCSEFVLATKEIPNEHFPIIVGRARIDYKQQTMIIDTDSYLRALVIISFLNCHTSKQSKILTHIATYNRFIFTSAKNPWSRWVSFNNYNQIFDETRIVNIVPDHYDVPDTVLDQRAKQQLLLDTPAVEKFPATNSNDAINILNWLFKFKHSLAQTISEGNNYSMYHFYKETEQQDFNLLEQ